jgi:RNA polymerase sigma-54 factor
MALLQQAPIATLALGHRLTQQAQLALHLLVMPCGEFQDVIREQLHENPFLQTDNEDEPGAKLNKQNLQCASTQSWYEYLDNRGKMGNDARRSFDGDGYSLLYNNLTKKPSLADCLIRQLGECKLSEKEKLVGGYISGNLDKNGYLRVSLPDICRATGSQISEAEAVLKQMQRFEPVGVAARNLIECLQVQLESRGEADSVAARIVAGYLEDLAAKRYGEIARALQITVGDVQASARLIASLEPKPARNYDHDEPLFVIPDLLIDIVGQDYVVSFNDTAMPRVSVNESGYRTLIARLSAKQKDYRRGLREKLRAARLFQDCVRQRQQTLYAVAVGIFERQREFLHHGAIAIKPMKMSDLAGALGMHESTVSRAVSDKWIRTPHGLFPLRYFFQDRVANAAGEGLSCAQVKAKIRAIIAAESGAKPLSDDEVTARLRTDYGIEIARRTVAKYREAMEIPAASQRRSQDSSRNQGVSGRV